MRLRHVFIFGFLLLGCATVPVMPEKPNTATVIDNSGSTSCAETWQHYEELHEKDSRDCGKLADNYEYDPSDLTNTYLQIMACVNYNTASKRSRALENAEILCPHTQVCSDARYLRHAAEIRWHECFNENKAADRKICLGGAAETIAETAKQVGISCLDHPNPEPTP
jgi:hypothetical protein